MKGRKPALPTIRKFRPGPAPVAPAWLDAYGRELWEQAVPQLGDFAPSDELAFAMVCDAWSIYRQARAELAEGLVYRTKGGEEKNPALSVAGDAWNRFWKGAAEFGLTPVGRARLKMGAPSAERDELDLFLAEHG